MSLTQVQNTSVDGAARVQPHSAPPAWLPYGDSPYLIGHRVASGGMGTVHIGLKQGALGFRRVLAIKRLHAHLADDPDFVARFKDEICVVSRLNHPNVVQTFDVVENAGELSLVMEFVEGVTLHHLLKDASARELAVPIPIAVGVVAQALHGLHAAHELTDDRGRPIHLVHRDVSPQNIMIGLDGLVKVLDFGVAKATNELHVTRTGQLSGKAPYMSPEQVSGSVIDRRTDVFAAGIVLWESLTGGRLFRPGGTSEGVALMNVLDMRVKAPSTLRPEVGSHLDRIVLRALDKDPSRRFGSARDFALALEDAVPEASLSAIAAGVSEICRDRLAQSVIELPRRDPADVELGGVPTTNTRLVVPHSGAPAGASVSAVSPSSAAVTRPLTDDSLASDVLGVPHESEAPPWSSAKRLFVTIALGVGLAAGAISAWLLTRSGLHQPAAGSVVVAADESREPVSSGDSNPDSVPDPSPDPVPDSVSNPARAEAPAAHEASSASLTPVLPPSNAATADEQAPRRPVVPIKANDVAQQRKGNAPPKAAPELAPDPCSPPTYVDREGIRHFKPECL